jgi:hypothetical protein
MLEHILINMPKEYNDLYTKYHSQVGASKDPLSLEMLPNEMTLLFKRLKKQRGVTERDDDAGKKQHCMLVVVSRADAMDVANSDTRQETATTRPTKATVMETETTMETKKGQERNLLENTLESVTFVAKPDT